MLQLYDWCREQKTNTNLKTIILPLLHSGIIVIIAALMKYIVMYNGSDSAGVNSSVRTSTSLVGHCGNDS